MENGAQELNQLINCVISKFPSGEEEFVVNDADSKWTLKTEHVLMLLNECGPMSNLAISKLLNVTPAAVTKMMKKLAAPEVSYVVDHPDETDGRVVLWQITDAGKKVAVAHKQKHEQTIQQYKHLLQSFDDQEQTTIFRFLNQLTEMVDN